MFSHFCKKENECLGGSQKYPGANYLRPGANICPLPQIKSEIYRNCFANITICFLLAPECAIHLGVSSVAGTPCNDVSWLNRAGCGEWEQQSDGSRPNPPKCSIILSLRWFILREINRSDAKGRMVVVVVELVFLNNSYCWDPQPAPFPPCSKNYYVWRREALLCP